MNKERLLQVADVVEKSVAKFDDFTTAFVMDTWFSPIHDPSAFDLEYRPDVDNPYECNSAACIAGFTCFLFDKENALAREKNKGGFYDHEYHAADLLDLTDKQATQLFMGPSNATGPEAAKVIRNLVQTGEVEWRVRRGDY